MSIINAVKGVFIGIALVIPGLSGSMFAVVVGLYDRLLTAINGFKQDIKKHSAFLIPIVIGVGVGILASTKLVLWLCENYIFQSYSFFIGLVLGSVPLVYRKASAKPINASKLFVFIISFIAIISLSVIAKSIDTAGNESYVSISKIGGVKDAGMVFFAGLFSCSLMAIPGVSGSIMLMLINQYGTVYNSVSKIGDMLRFIVQGNFEKATELLPAVMVVIPFIVGACTGIILISKLLVFLLSRFESNVYYGVGGLMAGAIVMIFASGVLGGLLARTGGGLISGLLGALVIVIYIAIGYLCAVFLEGTD